MTRVKRECRCARVRHEHGTEAMYSADGCRCLPCALARKAYTTALRAGLEPPRHTRKVHGARRRLQALTYIGWSPRELGERCDVNYQVIARLRHEPDGRTLLPATHNAIAALYDELWDKPSRGPHAARMTNLAKRHGWVPPLAWDDIDSDATPWRASSTATVVDEVAVERRIAGHRQRLTIPELAHAARLLHGRGWTSTAIARQLRMSGARVVQILDGEVAA